MAEIWMNYGWDIRISQYWVISVLINSVSGKHFPGPDFPLLKREKLTYFIHFLKMVGQHFPLCNFIKKGKVKWYFNKTLDLYY